MLFIAAWHLVSVLGVFLGFSAFLAVAGLLTELRGNEEAVAKHETAKWEKRSAAAKRGHETRRAKMRGAQIGDASLGVYAIEPEDEVERVLRQIDQQAEAKAK